MKVTRKCKLNGNVYTLDIPKLTPERLALGEEKMAEGAMIQNAFPFLNADEREFLLTGCTPEVWDRLIGSDE